MMQRSLSILLVLVVPLLMIQAANAQTERFTYTPRLQILDGPTGNVITSPQSVAAGAVVDPDTNRERANMLFLGISINAARTGGSGVIAFESMVLTLEFSGDPDTGQALDTESFLEQLGDTRRVREGVNGLTGLMNAPEWHQTLDSGQTTLDTSADAMAIIGRVDSSPLQYRVIMDDGLANEELRVVWCTPPPEANDCDIPIGTLIVDMARVPFDNVGILTVEFVGLDSESTIDNRPNAIIPPFGSDRMVVSGLPSQTVEFAITAGAAFSATPDVNEDGMLDRNDALALFIAYTSAESVGNGSDEAALAEGLRTRRMNARRNFLRSLIAAGRPDTDAEYLTLLQNANDWRANGMSVGGDVNGDNIIDRSDALVLFIAYTSAESVGNGSDEAALAAGLRTRRMNARRNFLRSLIAPGRPDTDAEYLTLLRNANALR